MANFDETGASSYNWATDGVYVIEQADPLEGGLEGVSNRQGRELAIRTRNLHERLADLKTETADRDAALEEDLDAKTEAAISSSKEYTDARETSILAAVDSKDVATMQSSKEYIDTTAVAVRSEMAAADTAALRDAKSYADTIVAALVSSSPEALNTLQELAAALGNDPNFATTVMQQIGERMKTTDVNAALAEKVGTGLIGASNADGIPYGDNTSIHTYSIQNSEIGMLVNVAALENTTLQLRIFDYGGRMSAYIRGNKTNRWRELYHSGNFNPEGCFRALTDNGNQNDIHQGIAQTGSRGTVSFYQHPYNELQFDYSLNGDQNSDIRFRLRNNNDASYSPWHTIFNSGNLGNPMRHYGVLPTGTNLTAWTHNGSWTEMISGSSIGYVNIYTSGSASSLMFKFEYGTGELYWKNGIDGNRWSGDFKRIWDSGNLPLAARNTNGLMSVADKAKLDGMSPVKIYARGKVLGDLGSSVSGSGQNGLVTVTVNREPNYKKGVYRLTHKLGRAGVCTFISLTRSKEQYSLTYRIDEDTPDYAIVRVHDIVNYNAYADCDFNYVIMA